jgi:hypothetical protein
MKRAASAIFRNGKEQLQRATNAQREALGSKHLRDVARAEMKMVF